MPGSLRCKFDVQCTDRVFVVANRTGLARHCVCPVALVLDDPEAFDFPEDGAEAEETDGGVLLLIMLHLCVGF